jgi:hypothetical protein
VQFGWSRPVQVTFRDNYLACSFLDYWMYWTYGPADFGGMVKPLPNVVTGNTIVLPPKTLHAATVDANMNPDAVQAAGLGVLVRTSYQGDAPTNLGEQSLDAADTFDNNLYLGIFRGLLYAGGKLGEYDLPGWRKATAAAGKEFDAGSKQAPMPTVPAVFVFANEYEPGRANVAVINWTKAATVKVDLSAALRRGAAFRMVKARDPYGPSVAEGVYKGPVSVPMEEEFAAFLVLPGR